MINRMRMLLFNNQDYTCSVSDLGQDFDIRQLKDEMHSSGHFFSASGGRKLREFLLLFPRSFRFIRARVGVIQLISVDVEEDWVYKPTERADPEKAEYRERMDVSDEESIQFPQPQQLSD